MKFGNMLLRVLLMLFVFVLYANINNIFDGNIWGPHYCAIVLGTALVLTASLFLIFRKGVFKISITTIDILLFLLMTYIGIQLLCMPLANAYISYFYILFIFIVIVKVFKLVFEGYQIYLLVLITFLLLLGALEGICGMLQYMELIDNHSRHFKMTGSFDNPGSYSNFLVVVLIFAYGFFLYFKPFSFLQNILRYFTLATAIIIIVALPFSEARSSWLAAIVGITFVSWPLVKTKPIIKLMIGNAKRRIFSFIILAIVIIVSSIFLYQYKAQSAKGRLLIYEVSFAMIKEKPVFGHGFCRFIAEYNNYQAAYFKTHTSSDKAMLADNVKSGFNEFIQIATELGITGLLFFVGFIVLVFRTKPRSEWNYLAFPAKGALLAVLVCCLFSYPLRILPIAVIIVFLLAIVMTANTDKGYTFAFSNRLHKLLALLVSVTALFICYLQWEDFQARKQWKQAIDYTQVQDYKKALPYYQNAYKELNDDGFFLYNFGSELLKENPVQSIKILEEATQYLSDNDLYVYLGDGYREIKKYEKAENCYLFSSFMVPSKFYPRYQLFKLYCETNQNAKAQAVAKTIAKMNVKVPSVTVYAIKGEIKEWLLNQK